VSAADCVTVLTTAGRDRGKLATKRITRSSGEWQIEDYANVKWWRVHQIEVRDIISLGCVLKKLEDEPHSCAIRGEPVTELNRACCRRLKDADLKDGTPASFEPRARHWLGIDADSIATAIWDADILARRRAALDRDQEEHPIPLGKGEDDGEDVDPDGNADPAPIDPIKDWAIAVRAVVITLPLEFHDVSAWWSMTSGAGLKPGIRMRLFFWLDRPVSDEEAKRWLSRSPVDTSLYGAVGIHYTAAPIFEPRGLDPVRVRSGWWWRHTNSVTVPDLTPVAKPKPSINGQRRCKGDGDAVRYAQACIDAVVSAPAGTGQGRRTLLAVARKLYGMANAGLLEQAKVTAALKDAMSNRGWTQQGRVFSPYEVERHLVWARDHADTTLPQGFR
jgi:hypothetical protein